MRHGKKRLQLSRFTSWHDATIKSLARNMIMRESIKTTLSRAKAVRPMVEKLISLAKSGSLSAKRRAFQLLGDHKLVAALFKDSGVLFAKRKGGYTRIINLAKRRGDNAQLVIFELTERKVKEIKRAKKVKAVAPEPQEEAQEKAQEKKPEAVTSIREKKETGKKPNKKFLGGIRNIFKKERDAL